MYIPNARPYRRESNFSLQRRNGNEKRTYKGRNLLLPSYDVFPVRTVKRTCPYLSLGDLLMNAHDCRLHTFITTGLTSFGYNVKTWFRNGAAGRVDLFRTRYSVRVVFADFGFLECSSAFRKRRSRFFEV